MFCDSRVYKHNGFPVGELFDLFGTGQFGTGQPMVQQLEVQFAVVDNVRSQACLGDDVGLNISGLDVWIRRTLATLVFKLRIG